MRERPKSAKLWVTCMFMCMVICFDIIALVTPDREFSENENRMLAQKPTFSSKSLSDGSFGKDAEKYLSDQFAGRDVWSTLSFFTKNSVFKQREMNGVYIGDDGYLMLIPSACDPASLDDKLAAVNAVAERFGDLNQCMMIVPNAVTVLADRLPQYAPVSEQPQQLEYISDNLHGVKFCDVSGTLNDAAYKGEEIFYHTDHHWTSKGAYLAFCQAAPDLQINPNNVRFVVYTASESFEGTLASKSGCHSFKDKIEIYVPKKEIPISVTYFDKDEMRGTLYETGALDTKDQYALFLGGNHPTVTIRTTAETGRSLLLIKDSYANCFAQFLTPFYDQIIIIDPRYCYDSVDMVIRQNGITDILYLYNADTFLTDASLVDFLAMQPAQENE